MSDIDDFDFAPKANLGHTYRNLAHPNEDQHLGLIHDTTLAESPNSISSGEKPLRVHRSPPKSPLRSPRRNSKSHRVSKSTKPVALTPYQQYLQTQTHHKQEDEYGDFPLPRKVRKQKKRASKPRVTSNTFQGYSPSVSDEHTHTTHQDGKNQVLIHHSDDFSSVSNEKSNFYYESNAGDGTLASDHYLTGFKLFSTILATFICLFISALDQTIVTTTFETVGNKFNAFDQISWLPTAFLIPMAVFAPSYGKISIAFGRKSSLIAGIIIFELGSLIAALANSMSMLIGGRVVQGVGAGCIQTIVGIIVTESVPISKRTLSMSSVAIAYSIASAIGPLLGGAFTEKVSWRWCYYVNLPCGGLALVLLLLGYNPPRPKGRLVDRLKCIDYLGSLLLVLGLVLLLTGLSFGGNEFSWLSAPVLLMLILGGIFFIIFLMYNLIVSKNPMFLKEFFTTPQIIFPAMCGFFNFAFFVGNVTYLTVYFQVIFGHTSFESGIDLMPLIVSVTISAVLNGILTKVTRHIKIFYVFSGVCGVVGTGMLLLLDRNTSSTQRIGYLIIGGISAGVQVQCTVLSCQMMAPRDKAGSLVLVTVFANSSRFLGAAVGTTLCSVVFNTIGRAKITTIIENAPYDVKVQLANVPSSEFLSSPALINELPDSIKNEIYDALMTAIKGTFWLCFGFSWVGFIFCLFATNRRVPKDEEIIQ